MQVAVLLWCYAMKMGFTNLKYALWQKCQDIYNTLVISTAEILASETLCSTSSVKVCIVFLRCYKSGGRGIVHYEKQRKCVTV